jgi:hypothetical protein
MVDKFVKLSYEQIDMITYESLKETRDNFLVDLGSDNPNVFVWGDPEEDKKEIQKHIDALDLILDWYRVPE